MNSLLPRLSRGGVILVFYDVNMEQRTTKKITTKRKWFTVGQALVVGFCNLLPTWIAMY